MGPGTVKLKVRIFVKFSAGVGAGSGGGRRGASGGCEWGPKIATNSRPRKLRMNRLATRLESRTEKSEMILALALTVGFKTLDYSH